MKFVVLYTSKIEYHTLYVMAHCDIQLHDT